MIRERGQEPTLQNAVTDVLGLIHLAQSRSGIIDPDRVEWERVARAHPQQAVKIRALEQLYNHALDILGQDSIIFIRSVRDYARNFDPLPMSQATFCLTVLLVNKAGEEGIPLFNKPKMRSVAQDLMHTLGVDEEGKVTSPEGDSKPLDMQHLVRAILT
jgi:hypothetical protein